MTSKVSTDTSTFHESSRRIISYLASVFALMISVPSMDSEIVHHRSVAGSPTTSVIFCNVSWTSYSFLELATSLYSSCRSSAVRAMSASVTSDSGSPPVLYQYDDENQPAVRAAWSVCFSENFAFSRVSSVSAIDRKITVLEIGITRSSCSNRRVSWRLSSFNQVKLVSLR